MKTALDLQKGESGYVKRFCDVSYGCKLLTLGLVPKSKITVVRRSPFGGCMYIKMGRQRLAIRLDEAQSIELED